MSNSEMVVGRIEIVLNPQLTDSNALRKPVSAYPTERSASEVEAEWLAKELMQGQPNTMVFVNGDNRRTARVSTVKMLQDMQTHYNDFVKDYGVKPQYIDMDETIKNIYEGKLLPNQRFGGRLLFLGAEVRVVEPKHSGCGCGKK